MLDWHLIKRFATSQPISILGVVAGLLLLGLGSLSPVSAWASSVEYRVKAAFLYNFTKFVEWPVSNKEKTQPFRIGILGQDPFGDEMQRLAGKAVGNRKLLIETYPILTDRAMTCDILYLSSSGQADITTIIRRLDGRPVLTIGDSADDARQGAIISFFMENNKVRFKINPRRAEQAGFKISSRLLKLAVIVSDAAQ